LQVASDHELPRESTSIATVLFDLMEEGFNREMTGRNERRKTERIDQLACLPNRELLCMLGGGHDQINVTGSRSELY
jgi:hypothetical protein